MPDLAFFLEGIPMPTLGASNRTQLAVKAEGVYPTNFGVLQGGNGKLVNFTGESLDYAIQNETSKAIRSDRQTTDLVQVGASASGGIQFEQVYKDLDTLMEGLFQSTWTYYGTNGLSAAIGTLTLTSTTITAAAAPAGNDAFTNLKKGQWFEITPPAGAAQSVKDYLNSRAFRVSLTVAPTSTVITVDAITPIDTAKAGTTLSGAQIGSARITHGSTMRSYSLEVGHLDIGQYRQYLGMIPSKFDLKLAAGAIVTGSMDFMGQSMKLTQATGMGTPTAAETFTPANAVRGIVDIYEGGSAISAVTYIKSADLSFDNSLRAQTALGVFGNAGIAAGTLKVTGKLEIYFASAAHYNKFINGSESSLAIPVLDPAGNGYIWYIPRLKYTTGKVATGGLDQDLMVSLDLQGLMDTAVGDTNGTTCWLYRVGI